jgi:retron-type reverse transcriptase
MNGVEQLFSDRPALEGGFLLLLTDTHRDRVIQDMVDLLKEHKEDFYFYHWSKLNSQGRRFHLASMSPFLTGL